MKNIIVYTMPKCAQCERTKIWLDTQELKYDTVDITQNSVAADRLRAEGYSQAPVVSINDFEKSWSGYQEDELGALL